MLVKCYKFYLDVIFLYSTNFPNTNAGNTWSILEYFTKVCYVIYAAQQSARSINYKTTVHVSVIDTRVFIEGLNFNFSEKHCALSSQPLNPILRLVWYSITNENKFHLRCGLELPFVFVQNIFFTRKKWNSFYITKQTFENVLKKTYTCSHHQLDGKFQLTSRLSNLKTIQGFQALPPNQNNPLN